MISAFLHVLLNACMALAISLGVSALTADREWRKVKAKGSKLERVR